MKSHVHDDSISSWLWPCGNVHNVHDIFLLRNLADLDIFYAVSYRH